MARFQRTLGETLAAQAEAGRTARTLTLGNPGLAPVGEDQLAPEVVADMAAQRAAVVAEAQARAEAFIDVDRKLADIDEAYGGVITEAGTLGSRLATAESELAAHEGRMASTDAELDVLADTVLPALSTDLAAAKARLVTAEAALAPLPAQVATAQSDLTLLKGTTVPALSADLAAAKGRLSTAETALAPLPAAMATAQSDLTNAFGELGTVDSRVATAKAAAIADAKVKADAAQAAAITAAALTAQAKADKALADAKLDATAKADAAKVAAIGAAATDAQAKADAALATANAQIAQVIARGQSLVRNGDFEAGNDGWTTSPFAAVETVTSRSGTKSMRVGPNPNGNVWPKSEFVPASTGRTYYVEVWAKRVGTESSANGLGFVIQSKTAAGGYVTPTVGLVNSLTVATDSWTKLSVTYTIPTADVVATCFAPWVRQGNNVYHFDDFLAVDVTEAQAALDAAAVADGLARAAQAAAGTAGANATAALTMAGSKSKVYYDTTVATGIATADGDLWRQRDSGNNIIGEWRWNGTPPAGAWVKTMLSSDAISNLDVGKLTAGAATIDTAVINKMAVQIASIIELNADRITAGKVTSAQVDTTNLAAALATILQLNANRITTGTLGAERINVTELAVSIATVLKLNANVITAGTIDTARLNVNTLAASLATILSLNADRITAGTIKVARLNTTAIAAATASIQTVDVKNLFATTGTMTEAVIKKLFTEVVMSQKITTQMMAVGAFDNLIPDPDFTNTGLEWGAMSGAYSITGEGRLGGKSLRIAASSSQAGKYSARIPSAGAATYRVTVWVKSNVAIPAGAIGIYTNTKSSASSGMGDANQRLRQANGTSAGNDPIPANTWKQLSCVADFADSVYDFAVGFYVQSSFTTGVVLFSEPSMTRMNAGELTVEGTVTAKALETELVLATKIVAGDPAATHAEMSPLGFKVFAAAPDGGAPNEVVRLGVASTDDYFAVTKADGSLAATISQDGKVSADQINANESLYYKGDELSAVLDRFPRGIVAAGYRATSSTVNASWQNQIPYLRVEAELEAGRIYKVWTSGMKVGLTDGAWVTLGVKYNSDGLATTASQTLTEVATKTDLDAPVVQELFALTSGVSKTVSFLVFMQVLVGQGGFLAEGGVPTRLVIEDVGPNSSSIGNGVHMNGTVPPTPAKNTYVKQYSATGSMNYQGNNSQYQFDTGRMYQGLSPAGYGNLKSVATFASMTGDLSGATINHIRVIFNFSHWYYNAGGTARIGLHGHAGIPGTFSGSGIAATSSNWPKPGARWVDLPSSVFNGFKTGAYRGVYLEGDSTYGTYGIASRPTIEISYTK